jgi:hypothetical protein
MRVLKAVVLVLALGAVAGPLSGCKSLQDAWENVRDTVD